MALSQKLVSSMGIKMICIKDGVEPSPVRD